MTKTTRIVSHAEAKEIALRLIAGSFRRDGETLPSNKRPNFSIPTQVNHDDDCLIIAYIEQQQQSWRSDFENAPSEAYDFFLVRPKGVHPASGKVWHPTIVQRIEGKFYTSTNELEPIYFGQDETDDHPLKTTLEWKPLPADWLTPSEAERI